MICPKCEHWDSDVTDSRTSDSRGRRRRRKCKECSHSFTTYEVTAGFMKEASRNKRLLTHDNKMIDQAIAELNKIKRGW